MLRILMSLMNLAINTPWSDVLAINEALFMAMERRALTWDSWPELNRWWGQAISTLSVRQAGNRLGNNQAPALGGSKRGGDAPPSLPPAKVQKRAVMGVPGDWLRDQNLCIKFNLGRCSTAAPHPSPVVPSNMLRHLCGGCLYMKKGSDGGHGMSTCPNKPGSGFFS